MLNKDAIDLHCLNAVLIGPNLVGKTATINHLVDAVVDIILGGGEERPSTGCDRLFPYFSSDDVYSGSISFPQETKHLFQYLCGYKVEGITDEPEDGSQIQKEAKLMPEQSGLEEETQEGLHSETEIESTATLKLNPKHTMHSTQQSTSRVKRERVQNVIDRLQSLRETKFFDLINLVGSYLLCVCDIGGKQCFLEMFPALRTGPAMYLVFLNLNKELDKPYSTSNSSDYDSIPPSDTQLTVESYISQILSRIARIQPFTKELKFESNSATPEKIEHFLDVPPVATLMGTHKDYLADDFDLKVMKIDSVLGPIASKHPQMIVSPDPNLSFFGIDNVTEVFDIRQVRDFISITYQIYLKDVSVPIHPRWLWLILILRREYKIISKVESLDFAKSLGIDKEEFEFALWYLHYCTGILLYFPDLSDDWFNSYIICSLEVVFESIRELIVAALNATPTGSFVEEDLIEQNKKVNSQ